MKQDRAIWYRRLLALFLIFLIYDGSIRKWLLPSAEQVVFVAKDLLLVATLCFWLFSRRTKAAVSLHPGVRLALVLYAFWVVLQVFNINLPNLAVGIWGLKSHLLYASMIFFIPMAFKRLDELFQQLEKIYPWVVIPVCSLAFIQLLAPADSFINQQVRGGLEGIAQFGDAGLVRVTGTFSYLSGMAAFVQSTCLLGIALYLGGVRSSLFLVGFAFAMAALPVTGSRAVVAVVALGGAMQLMAAFAARLIRLRSLLQVAVGLAMLGAISIHTQDAAWAAFVERSESSRTDEGRWLTAATNAFDFMDVAGLTGFGTGSANLGAVALSGNVKPFSWLPNGNAFEEESGRIVLELGIVGWFLSMMLRVALLIWASSLVLRGKTPVARLAGVLALPVMALGVQQGNGVFAVPFGAVYYWFCVALMAMARYQDRVFSGARLKNVVRI